MRSLISIDQHILLSINGLHSPFFDQFFWVISSRWLWIPLYLVLLYAIGKRYWQPRRGTLALKRSLKENWRCILLILSIFACVGLSDYISSGIIKPLVCRYRPTHEPALAGLVHIVHNYTGGLYGFVSSHAADTVSVTLLCSLLLKNKWWTLTLTLYCILNCYSRMYLGMHYPLDILGGLIVGTAVALSTYYILKATLLKKHTNH